MGRDRHLPLETFVSQSGYTKEFVTEININPYLFTEEEILDYVENCEKYKFFYNNVGRCITGSDMPFFQLTGNISHYIKPFTDCRATIIHSKLPDHYIHKAFRSRWIVCCQTIPSNIYQCLSLPVVLLDGQPQDMFRQIITPDPKLTVKVFMEMHSKVSDPIPLSQSYQMEIDFVQ